MTCRHGPYDPNCGSYNGNLETLKADYQKQIVSSITPDAERFSVEDVEEIGTFLVMKVRYPNCSSCSYEGVKVMVFSNANLKSAIKWKKIDPHFRDPDKNFDSKHGYAAAPGPIARFPASDQGWKDAIEYANSRTRKG